MNRRLTGPTREALLVRDGGAIANGRRMRPPASRRPVERSGFSLVVVSYAPDWACDRCRATGIGGILLLAHHRATGHAVFTERHPDRYARPLPEPEPADDELPEVPC